MVEATRDFTLERALETGHAARLAIIVEELVTNLVEHGGVTADGLIELALTEQAGAVEIALSDSGVAYDPRIDDPDAPIPDRGGGAGIDLIKAWAEIVDYRSHNGQNRLLLKMWVS